MRFSIFSAFLAIFVVFLPREGAYAAVWVEQISGNQAAIVIARKGNFLKAEEMMRLQPGDIIKVLDNKSSIRVLLGSGTVRKVTKSRSPYTVAGKIAGGSFFTNLVGEVKQMLLASKEETQAVAMITRGEAEHPEIRGVSKQNLVLTGSQRLVVGWQGGKAPYAVSLSYPDEEDEPIMSMPGLSGDHVALDIGKISKEGLEDTRFEILVKGPLVPLPAVQKAATTEKSKVTISIVTLDQLPDEAQKLLKLGLDKRVEARFLIAQLRKKPEWRFFSYSLALEHALENERLALVPEPKPAKKNN